MNIVAAFITNSESAKLVKPRKRSLDHPAEDAQSAAVFCSAFGQNCIYAHFSQYNSMRLAVVGSIALHTLRTFPRTSHFAGYRRNRLNQRHKLGNVMTVGACQFHRERDAACIGDNVMFRPQLPSIRRIRAGFRPPKTARTDDESTTAREKSILSFSRRWSRSIRCILSQMPAFCQSFKRRQHVCPEPQPISFGRYCQGIPVFSTKMMPVNTLRSSTGGLPPLGRGGRSGIIALMSFHNLLSNSGLAMCLSSVPKCRNPHYPMDVLSDKPLHIFKVLLQALRRCRNRRGNRRIGFPFLGLFRRRIPSCQYK